MTTAVAAVRSASAGRSGKDVRSDCAVHFEPRTSGGIEVGLRSRVEAYYGESIRQQAREVLVGLGVQHCLLRLEDEGALPFAIAARIEAAVVRSGIDITRTSTIPPHRQTSTRDRLRRSRLYLPGNEPKYFVNAALHEPDAIILDLEDSVHPDEKDAARLMVRNALAAVDFGACERMVRINQLPLGFADLDVIVPQRPDLILIPKVEHAEEVAQVAARLHALETAFNVGPIWIMPILESALGIENAFAIATASDRVVALTLGLEDYTADLGVAKTRDGAESLYARLRVVNAARAAGLQAIDSVYGDIGDMEGLRAWGERSRGLGFEGMGCIHPAQIAVIHQAYAPTAPEIEKALKIVAAFEAAQREGRGVVNLGSKMIDAPVVERARKLVARARDMRLISEEAR